MRLNRLEIAGFKSFAERSEVAFDAGVTAIVGPNGCGKSNVVDAITWVLGEQSAKSLRGDRMEDVIFSGSDARKPTAAAEVRLKLGKVPSGLPAGLTREDVPAVPVESAVAITGAATGGNGDRADEVIAAPLPPEFDLAPRFVRDVEIGRRLYRSG